MISPASPRVTALKKALIVEDVPALRTLLRISLERCKVTVWEAEGLQRARQILRDGVIPDVVVLDLELGDGLGLDVVREIPVGASVHVLTADPTEETRLRCQQAGCSSVSDKTKDLNSLVERITSVSARQKSVHRHRVSADRQYLEFLAESRVKLRPLDISTSRQTLRDIAHRLSGTAIHFGYPGLGDAAQGLRQVLAESTGGDVNAALNVLDQRIGEALDAFQYQQRGSRPEEYQS